MTGSDADLVALGEHDMLRIQGGWTGSPELARDIGRLIGAVAGVYFVFGRALYQSGGLFGQVDR